MVCEFVTVLQKKKKKKEPPVSIRKQWSPLESKKEVKGDLDFSF